MKKIYLLFTLVWIIISCAVFAQSGSNDPSFNSSNLGFGYGEGADDLISTIALQSDGKIIIGGNFTSYNRTARKGIARLNSDGSLDTTFSVGIGVNGPLLSVGVRTCAIQSDGKIVIGGWFTSYNGTTRNSIARLNSDGSLDNTFDAGAGANGTVNTIAIQSDGRIIIGGAFYNGFGYYSLVRLLNSDGSIDSTFTIGKGTYESVFTSAIQSDGKIIIGGSFSEYNWIKRYRIARLNSDGSLDNTFIVGTNVNGSISTIAIQSDGKIIMGGFTSYDGFERNSIARLYSDGSLDTTFAVGTGALVFTCTIQSDGKIIIGGGFDSYNGTAINRIARLNSDGSLDTTFVVGTGAYNSVETSAIQSDGKIIIGGEFTSYNGTTRNRIARLNSDGSLDSTFVITGIDENKEGVRFSVHPNPFIFQTVLQTDVPLKNATLRLDNVFGQTVKEIRNINGNSYMLYRDNNFPAGLYFIRLTEGNKQITTKKVIIID